MKNTTPTLEEMSLHYWIKRGLLAALWIASIFCASKIFEHYPNILTFLLVGLLVGIPICLSGICHMAIRKRREVGAVFQKAGLLARLWQGQILIWARWILIGFVTSTIIVLQAHVLHDVIWLTLVICIPAFSYGAFFLKRWARRHGLHDDIALLFGLRWSRWLISVILILLAAIWALFVNDNLYNSIREAVDSVRGQRSDEKGFVSEALNWFSWIEGTRLYVMGQLHAGLHAGQVAPLTLVWTTLIIGIDVLILVWASFALSAFYLPSGIFVDAGVTAKTPVGVFIRLAIIGFLPFILLPISLVLEPLSIQIREWRVNHEQDLNKVIERTAVEIIHGGPCDYYRLGTKAKIKAMNMEETAKLVEAIHSDIDDMFHHLETDGVTELLDWYYSQWAEYDRLRVLLLKQTDGLEVMIGKMIDETIGVKAMDAWYTASSRPKNYERVESAWKKINMHATKTLDENCVEGNSEHIDPVSTISSLNELTGTIDALNSKAASTRFTSSGAIGGITAAITAKLAGKIAIKAGGSLVAKAMSSGAIGAAIGATAGFVAPGVGNLVGGFIGFTLGVAVGLAVDYSTLAIDEQLNRSDMEAELIDELQEVKQQMLSDFLPKELQ